MEENELFGETHEQEENGLFGRRHQAEQLNLCGVVVPKGTCCLKPKKIGKVNDMFESWDECKNCGKEVL
jgi:hypothetical protein